MASTADARTSDNSSGLLRAMRLGKYQIERQLGAGGMGTVFLAVDSELRRTVALKVLPKERAANPQLVRRFKSEGQAAARLEHENIVKVFEAGEIDGHLFLALEYIDGIDVQELVSKRGRLPVRRSIEIVTQVAAALQHASERGIVHRDIKPSNLLIRKDGLVKLADMGLARAIDETVESSITHAGMTVGTVDYISPEQGSNSKQADIRSDLYSLGCSWYHMLTGEVPYPEGTAIDKLRAHSTARIPDPRRINERIPAAVVAVLQRLMAKQPENRHQTPAELIEDLQRPSLLRHETGAADIAALASSADDEDRDETVQDADFHTTAGEPARRRQKPSHKGTQPPGRDAMISSLSDSVEIEPEPTPSRPAHARRPGAKRSPVNQPDNRSRQQPERKSKRPAVAPGGASRRELPPRSERPEQFAVNHRTIDPQTLKVAAFGLIAVLVVSALGWMAWRAAQDRDGELTPAGASPFARVEDNLPPATPPVIRENAPETNVSPPPSVITDFRPSVPFPGVSDATGDAKGADVPRWVYEAREQSRADAQIVVVDPRGSGYRTAADALSALPASGGILEFHGRGPFEIGEFTLHAGQDVLLRAAAGSQPVLHLADQAGQISVRNGRLELDGLHLVASGRGRNSASPLIHLDTATLLFRNGSITLADPAEAATPAVRLSGAAGGSSRCVLENSLIRGNSLSAAVLDGAGHGLVAGNCLIDSGAAPAIALLEPAGAGLDPATTPTVVELLQSILVSRFAAIQGEQRAATAPTVRLRFRRVVLDGAGPDATAIRLTAWPETSSSELDQPRATGVRLITEQTILSAWPVLTLLQSPAAAEPVSVTDEARWLQFWRAPLGVGSRIVPLNPAADFGPHPADAVATLSRLTQQFGPDVPLDGYLDVASLPTLPDSLIARVVANSARPRVPANLDAPFTGPVVKFDINKNGLMLNRLLNGPECPDGARVVLTGKRRALIEPVTVRGKSLRLEFDGGGEPLTIEPAPRPGAQRPPALFQVEQGRLDLVNAHVRIPSSETSTYPLRLVQAVDGSMVIRRCLLLGQFGAGAQDVPTIEWTCTESSSQFLRIEDSLVAGQSQAITGQIAGQLVELRNSIAVSGGDCLRFHVPDAAQRGTIHIADSMLSAGAAVFRLAPPVDGAAGRLQVFVDHSIYGPPLIDGVSPVVLVQPARGDQTVAVEWWETRTAVSDRIPRFRVADDSRTTPQDINDAWVRGWGADHVVDSVAGPLSVIFAARQVDLSKALPSDFRLDAKSAAAAAAADGGSLGPDVGQVGPGHIDAASPVTPTKPPPKPAAPRKGTRLDF